MPANLVMRTESFRHNINTKISVNMEEKGVSEQVPLYESHLSKRF